MRDAHGEPPDLNLLEPLRALLEERHVTRAAERCRLSQPAMSRALERLRVMFADDLLVRVGVVYERTARAERVLTELQDILPRIYTAVRGEPFDPLASKSRFTIATTDIAATVLVPKVTERVQTLAPGISLDILAWDDRSLQDVDSGLVDLAVIPLRGPVDIEYEELFSDEFVCIVANEHPLRDERMTLEQFIAYPHISLTIKNGGQPCIEETLAKVGLDRRGLIRTPYLLSAVLAAACSTSIFTTAGRVVPSFMRAADVRTIRAPKEFPPIRYGMAWHRRLRDDRPHAWLRGIVRDIAASV